MDVGTIGIVTATFIGPIAAVLITRYVDRLRDNEKRRLEVFRALMRTRRMFLSPDHVDALNLVEIEFHKDTVVMEALKALMAHFETGYGEKKTVDEINAANIKSDDLRTKLLSAIARTLKYKFEQMEILRGGYLPEGWSSESNEKAAIRRGMASVFNGQKAIPITIVQPSGNAVTQTPPQQASPFPPKPT